MSSTNKQWDHFGDAFDYFVKKSGKSLPYVEGVSGINRETLKNWRQGAVKKPRHIEDVLKVAIALSLSPQNTDILLLLAKYPSLKILEDSPGTSKEAAQLVRDINDGRVYPNVGDSVEPQSIIVPQSPQTVLDAFLNRAVLEYESSTWASIHGQHRSPNQPYKFLYSYTSQDADIFFGRDYAIRAMHEVVLKDRLTILHATSGVGKTSLLNAGLTPHLIEKQRFPVYARAYQNPTDAIKQAIIPGSLGWPKLLSDLSLHEFLGRVCDFKSDRIKELVIILDQFEEFFIFQSDRNLRRVFIEDFADVYNDKRLPIRFIISIRKDYYSDLVEFQEQIPNVLYNEFRLEFMNRDEAQQAITAPLTNLARPIRIDQNLLDILIDDLTPNGIELPHLQIICTQLYEDALESEKHCIELVQYEEFGRASGILGDYLVKKLEKFPGHGVIIAQNILKELVSSEETKRVVSYNTLVARADANHVDEFDHVLLRLQRERLLRRDEVRGEILYEMAHEYLIEQIKQWIDQEDLAVKRIQELIEREIINWRLYNTLIPLERLKLIYAQRERIGQLSEDAQECILRSATIFGFTIDEWSEIVGSIDEQLHSDILLDTISTVTDNSIRLTLLQRLGDLWNSPQISDLGNEIAETRKSAVLHLPQMSVDHTVQLLISILRDEIDSVRLSAASVLANLGDAAVEPLIAILHDEESDVRLIAAYVLGNLGNERAIEPLIALLHDEHMTVRWSAACALGKLGDERATETLLVSLEDADKVIRSESAYALGMLGNERAIEPLIATLTDEDQDVRQNAVKALGVLGNERAIEPLIAVLRDKDDKVRTEASQMLGRLGNAAVEPLIDILRDEDQEVRRKAVVALGIIGDERAIEPLLAAFNDEYAQIRITAPYSFRNMGDAAVKPLLTALQSEEDHICQSAADALGWLGNSCAVEPLIALLRDKDEASIPYSAVDALGRLGDERAVKPLIDILGNTNEFVRGRASYALVLLGNPAVESLIVALQHENKHVRSYAAGVLGQLDDERAVEPLIDILHDEDQEVRLEAIAALGTLGDKRAIEPLIASFQDSEWEIGSKASYTLSQLGDATIEPLVAALQDENRNVRRHAANTLGDLGDKRAIEPLIIVLQDEDKDVRQEAAFALGWLGDGRAIDSLIIALKDNDNQFMRQRAVFALKQLNNQRSLKALISALQDNDNDVQRYATDALTDLADEQAVEPLVAILQDKDPRVREIAVRLLGQLNDERAIEPLIAALQDEDKDVRIEIRTALINLGDIAVEPLIAAMQDESWEIRAEVARLVR